jgi:3-methylfumaryl-CoA hydratase
MTALDWSEFLGREERRQDWIVASRVAAWEAVLDRPPVTPSAGDPIPPGFHWTLAPLVVRESELGGDGQPPSATLATPPLPHRLWAGCRVVQHRLLRVGDAVERRSALVHLKEKQGRAGPLVFATFRHVIVGPEGPAVEEWQELVFRDRPAPLASAPPANASTTNAPLSNDPSCRTVIPSETQLFRFSALTFNAHRIHYDRRYACEVEGHAGLVVQGPHITALLLDVVRRERPHAAIQRFEARARRPAFDGQPMFLTAPEGSDHVALRAIDRHGQTLVEVDVWTV